MRPSSQRAKTPFDGSKRGGFHFEQAESRRFPRNKTPITTKRSPSPASARPEDRTFLQGDLLSDPKRSSEDHLIFIDLLRSLKMRWRTAGFSPSFGLVHPVPSLSAPRAVSSNLSGNERNTGGPSSVLPSVQPQLVVTAQMLQPVGTATDFMSSGQRNPATHGLCVLCMPIEVPMHGPKYWASHAQPLVLTQENISSTQDGERSL